MSNKHATNNGAKGNKDFSGLVHEYHMNNGKREATDACMLRYGSADCPLDKKFSKGSGPDDPFQLEQPYRKLKAMPIPSEFPEPADGRSLKRK